MRFVDLGEIQVDGSALARVPGHVARRHTAIPIGYEDGKLVVVGFGRANHLGVTISRKGRVPARASHGSSESRACRLRSHRRRASGAGGRSLLMGVGSDLMLGRRGGV